MNEEWLPITGFEGTHQISNTGKVLSVKFQKVMSPFINNSGYERVTLKRSKFYVHRLVALHFVPTIAGKDVVNHKDGNGRNNHFTNLEWTTQSENMQHHRLNGNEPLRGKMIECVELGISAASANEMAKLMQASGHYVGRSLKTVGFRIANVARGDYPNYGAFTFAAI